MAQANYREISELLATKTPFKGNSCHAFIDDENVYRVFSYSTQIALFQLSGEPNPWLNPSRYSVTTSRLQNLIKKAWSI